MEDLGDVVAYTGPLLLRLKYRQPPTILTKESGVQLLRQYTYDDVNLLALRQVTGPVTGVRQHQVPVIAHPRSTTLGPGLIVVGADVDPVRSTELLRAGERPGLDQREAGKTEERQHVLFSHSRLYFTWGSDNRSFYRRLSGEGRSTVHIRQLIIHNSGISIKFTLFISKFSYSTAIFKSKKVFICRENKS